MFINLIKHSLQKLPILLSTKALHSKDTTFLVKFCSANFNPVHYYLSQPVIESDPFKLSLISYHLVKLRERDVAVLHKVNDKLQAKSDKSFQSFRNRVESEIASGTHTIDSYLSELKRVIKLNLAELPVESSIKALYSLVHSGDNDFELYKQTLLPAIRVKLQYASYENLVDLASTLNKGKFFEDAELWNSLFQQLENKLSQPKTQTVHYSGWTLDTYQAGKEGKSSGVTANEAYFADLAKSGIYVSDVKAFWRTAIDLARARVWLRLFQGEKRVNSLANRIEGSGTELVGVLEEVRQTISDPRIDNIIDAVKAKWEENWEFL